MEKERDGVLKKQRLHSKRGLLDQLRYYFELFFLFGRTTVLHGRVVHASMHWLYADPEQLSVEAKASWAGD